MPNPRAAFLGLAATKHSAVPVNAARNPTLPQIYDLARAGHLDRAAPMITRVQLDYSRSAKAHYVAADLASQAGRLDVARGELEQAERLDPGLPFARPAALRAMKPAIDVGCARADSGAFASHQHIFLLIRGILLEALGVVVWAIVRRRRAVPTDSELGAGPASGWGDTRPAMAPTGSRGIVVSETAWRGARAQSDRRQPRCAQMD